MISWTTIAYGAAVSALAAGLVVALTSPRHRLGTAAGAAAAAIVGPVAWNAILTATHADTFFTDAPIAIFPASWQDAGSGVFTLAAATLILGLGTLRAAPAHRVASVALLAAGAAFLVDVYLY